MSTKQLYEDPEFKAETGWKRPHEVHEEPKFIYDGASRLDVHQGGVGDCWFIAAAATLATRPELFKRVVPEGQSFGPDYFGQFRFNFWRHGKWTEVVIDDRLPTKGGKLVYCSNKTTTQEFWPALLEKAYAKLVGSYKAMNGGYPQDALVDCTGGIGHIIDIKKYNPQEFLKFLLAQNDMCTLMGCAFYNASGRQEEILPNGLVTGHAYSITSIKLVMTKDGEKQLLRLRNPWGKIEWKGDWSDSDEKLDDSMRQELGLVISDDGEFWMSYQDWFANFEELHLCHMPPDVKLEGLKEWKEIAFQGSWEKKVGERSYGIVLSGSQSGGRAENTNTVIISLMQMCAPRYSAHMVLDFYEVKSGKPQEIRRLVDGRTREISDSISLEDGTYVIIPSTRQPQAKGEYLLRIYTDGCVESSE